MLQHQLQNVALSINRESPFIPPANIRYLRLIARQRQKLGGMLASEENRLHKILSDAGIRLGVLVSDIHGLAARTMVKAIIAGKPMPDVVDLAGRLRASRALELRQQQSRISGNPQNKR